MSGTRQCPSRRLPSVQEHGMEHEVGIKLPRKLTAGAYCTERYGPTEVWWDGRQEGMECLARGHKAASTWLG